LEIDVALFLIDTAAVDCYNVTIKFGRTVKISSLKNANFTVYTDAATPVQISAPFVTIDTIKDYNQISRILNLYWKTTLTEGVKYNIFVTNLIDASGNIIDQESIKFTQPNCGATPSTTEISDSAIDPVLIEDKSIKTDIDVSYQILAKNPLFYIDSTDPIDGDFYIPNNYENGRVVIEFNARPASNFLSTKYFICQRKKIQRTPSRWEDVAAEVKIHSWKPEIYIDFPSLEDATPSYFTEGKKYFQKGYKYRITVSKDVGI
jgi:hypothetical protein